MILSLKVVCLIFLALLIGCKSKSQIEPSILQPENIKIVVKSQKYDSVLYWFTDDYKIDDNGLEFKKERLSDIKKNYSIKQGKIFYGNTLLDRVKINYTINKDLNKSIIIENGLPSYDYKYNIESVPPYLFDDSGGTLSMNNLLNIFKKGNGMRCAKQELMGNIYKKKINIS